MELPMNNIENNQTDGRFRLIGQSCAYTNIKKRQPREMLRKRSFLRNYLIIILGCVSSQLPAVGLLPVPTLTDVSISASVELVGGTAPYRSEYKYAYIVSNPATNTGNIWYVKVDVSSKDGGDSLPSDPTYPVQGGHARANFNDKKASFDDISYKLKIPRLIVVPFGQNAPLGWNGGFGRDGFAGFATATGAPTIEPGQAVGGLELTTLRVPSLREVILVPEWIYEVKNLNEATDEGSKQAAKIMHDLKYHLVTLGPSFFAEEGGFDHWNQLHDDINQMGELGWISATLATTLSAQLAEARSALDATDGTLAKTRLQPLVDTISNASASDMNAQAKQLLVLNTDSLLLATEDTLIPFEPEFTITPLVTELEVGELYEFTIKVTNKADQDAAVPSFLFNLFDEGSATESQILTDINVSTQLTTLHNNW
jgi:hypothetical protein